MLILETKHLAFHFVHPEDIEDESQIFMDETGGKRRVESCEL
jgi:hypothetical protein